MGCLRNDDRLSFLRQNLLSATLTTHVERQMTVLTEFMELLSAGE